MLSYEQPLRQKALANMKRIKTQVFVLIIIAAFLVSATAIGFFWFLGNGAGGNEKFIVLNENLYWKNNLYIRQADNMEAVQLGGVIGITDLKQQVYSIKGQDPLEWVCVRNYGAECIYKKSTVPKVSIQTFFPDTLIIKNEYDLGGEQYTITNKQIINAAFFALTDDNILSAPVNASSTRMLILFSNEYPGLCYKLSYLHDRDGGCYLYDGYYQQTWEIGHELMEYII